MKKMDAEEIDNEPPTASKAPSAASDQNAEEIPE